MTKLLALPAFMLCTGVLAAQVALDLTFDETSETFTVSVFSEQTYHHPDNMTATAQITLVAPTNTFELVTFENLTGAQFAQNSRSNAPAENPSADYISFGLATNGTDAISYTANTATPLFRFTLADPCAGPIALVDNTTDPFMPPNTALANIGNDVSVFGAAQFPTGLTENREVDCRQQTTSTRKPRVEVDVLRVFPNPVVERVNVELQWDAKPRRAQLRVLDLAGKAVQSQQVRLERGTVILGVPVKTLAPGTYFLELETARGTPLRLGRFVRA